MLNYQNISIINKQLEESQLVAVTKYVGLAEIDGLIKTGIHDFGENRVDVFLEKYKQISSDHIVWHFIGHLQSKKVKKVINKINYLHSLESLSLADEIEKRRTNPLNCFLEVNISEESQKYGLDKKNVIDFYEKIKNYDKINVVGFMGMATHTDDKVKIRRQFQVLLDLKEEFKVRYSLDMKLSMGMSNDYQIALAMGSDFVRIGSLLYKGDK